MLWDTEHGKDYMVPEEILKLVRDGLLKDVSWHNDACPRFQYTIKNQPPAEDGWVDVWCEHPLEASRECMKKRFGVDVRSTGHDTDIPELDLQTDDATEVAELIRYLFKPTVEDLVYYIKREIRDLVRRSIIPRTAKSFSELHNYMDANCLGYTEALWSIHGRDKCLEWQNPALDKVDAWIKAGGIEKQNDWDFRDEELMLWTRGDESSARLFFGAPADTPVRLVKPAPETPYEKEKYREDAKLYAVTNWRRGKHEGGHREGTAGPADHR